MDIADMDTTRPRGRSAGGQGGQGGQVLRSGCLRLLHYRRCAWPIEVNSIIYLFIFMRQVRCFAEYGVHDTHVLT